ncbi:MAG: ORF6N domain-containing protein [Deltaproteobacteria bacterium]|nr:ORF6N domain-containing protein [Deltaproteobacteria bacterium]
MLIYQEVINLKSHFATSRLNWDGRRKLKRAVKRNPKRFPDDFMFELTQEELNNWRSQFVTSKAVPALLNSLRYIRR